MSSEDRTALVALFRSTGGDRWTQNDSWDTNAELRRWRGVRLNRDGRVIQLGLSHNNLQGPLPEALGNLRELLTLDLRGNRLTGFIPKGLGSLPRLQQLRLFENQLAGPIPEELGYLENLSALDLHSNKLTGPIPETLGDLKGMMYLDLSGNKLTGRVPKELGSMERLGQLRLEDNNLTGAVPTELANLSTLSTLQVGNTRSKAILRRGNKLTGGPAKGEALGAWKDRILRKQQAVKDQQKEARAPEPPPSTPPRLLPQQQEAGESDEKEENAPMPLGSPTQGEEVALERTVSREHDSLSLEQAEPGRLFRVQLSSSAWLDSLIGENPEALEDIQRVIESQVPGSVSPDDERSDMERHRELGTLASMSTALGEVVLKHTEDMDVQQKELALPAFWRAYYTAVRTGLCEAYLAASVINSDWVSTSKTGGMGKAGAALKLLSSAVPVVGGLPELAGKALETGDHYLQTRRLVKIAAMAPDAMECCSLARKLALQLTDGLKDDSGAGADQADQVSEHVTACMNGGSGSGGGANISPDIMSEDDVFEYVLEEVASYERGDHGGKRLGKKHLRKLLNAIQRGCLDDSSSIGQKATATVIGNVPPKASTFVSGVHRYLQNGDDIEGAGPGGETALTCAAVAGHLAVVELLLDEGASIICTDSLGRTPLFNAVSSPVRSGCLEVVRRLLKAGSSVTVKDTMGNLPVHGAAFGGNRLVMKAVLEAGGDVMSRNGQGHTPLMIATQNGHIGLFQWLLRQGRNDVNDTCPNGMSPLFIAADYSSADMVETVIKAGGKPGSRTIDGWTPLHAATRLGNVRMIRALIQAGAEPDAPGMLDNTPLNIAGKEGQLEAARELMKAGADPLTVCSKGASPLYNAVVESNSSIAVEMLKTLERKDEEEGTVYPSRASRVGKGLFRSDRRFMTLVNGAVYGLEFKSLSKLLSMGALDPFADEGGDERAAAYIELVTPADAGLPPKDPVLKACMRRMIARRVAFTATSWLWPLVLSAGKSGGEGKANAGRRRGMAPVGVARCRPERRRHRQLELFRAFRRYCDKKEPV